MKIFSRGSRFDEAGRLKTILISWVENSKKYTEKFDKWVEKYNNYEGNSIYNNAFKAAQELEKANKNLFQTLIGLEGVIK